LLKNSFQPGLPVLAGQIVFLALRPELAARTCLALTSYGRAVFVPWAAEFSKAQLS
jgi:hypothetical protein